MTIWDEIEDDDPKEWKKRIGIDPKIMFGTAVIAGTRIPVWIILEVLGMEIPIEKILDSYPGLTREDVLAALLYAAEVTEEPVAAPS